MKPGKCGATINPSDTVIKYENNPPDQPPQPFYIRSILKLDMI